MTTHMKRRGLRVGVAAAAALALTACGAGNGSTDPQPQQPGGASEQTGAAEISGDITLLTPIYEGTSGQQLLENELLPEFYEMYPDVRVEVDYTTYGQLNEKLTTAVASGLIPDVMMMGVGWIEGFADRGILLNLGEQGLTPEGLIGDYTESIVEAGTWDGDLYGMPIMLDTRFGVARSDILAEAGYDSPPQTWDELVEIAIATTVRNGNTLERAGFDMLSQDIRQVYETVLFSTGGSLFNDDLTAPAFNEPAGVQALEQLVDLMNEHQVEDMGFSSTSAEMNPLLNGRSAMGLAHNNVWTQGVEVAPDVLDDLEPFLIPGEQPGMFFGGTFATLSARSQHPEAATALMEFLAGPEAALAANEQRGNVPALVELLDTEYVQSNRFVQFAMENLEHAQREGGPPAWLEIRGEFKPNLEAALLQQKTPQEALDDLAAQAEAAMAR